MNDIKMTSLTAEEFNASAQDDIKDEVDAEVLSIDKSTPKTTLVTKEVQLPSNGYFGGPTSVVIRGMTAKEERTMYVSKDFNFISQIVRACIVEPKEVSLSRLHPKDVIYLLFAIREMTFGPRYKQDIRCEYCGFKQTIDIDITEMDCDILDVKNIEEKLTVTLPDNGDTLQLQLLSEGRIQALDKVIEKKVKKGVIQDPANYDFIVKLSEQVVSRNGEDFQNEKEKHNYLLNLSGKDYNKIVVTINKIENSFGLDQTIYSTCSNPNCEEEMEVIGAACPEFFRPTE